MVFLGFHAAAVRVLAGARDGEFAFALQELEGVAGFFRALFLDDGEYLVFEVALAEIVKALAGHGGVFHLLLGGEERQHGVHEGGFPGGAGGLDDDGERFAQLAGGAGEVGGQQVGFLAGDSGLVVGCGDALEQVGGPQEFERFGVVGGAKARALAALLARGR